MGDQNRTLPAVEKMPLRWIMTICPRCNGLILPVGQVHSDNCPNRLGLPFEPRTIVAVPIIESFE